jgi:non-specific serine/threonine protein kinase
VAGLSQEQLADRAGLSRRGIADLERGARRSPYPNTVYQLANALRLDANDYQALFARAHPTTAEATNAGRLPSLPAPPSELIGRKRELAELRQRLKDTRLLTLTGAGGSGKTRLALEVARARVDAYPDGTALVLLGPLSDPDLVAPEIARILGVRERAETPLRQTLVSHLAPRKLMLILDNFEHLLDAAPLISDLLGACPKLTVLATSREALRLREEQEFPVPPLALPAIDRNASAATLMRCASVQLFGRRAAQFVPDFGVTPANSRMVADICLRLDGLPLAIELAAARMKVLSPALLLERLEHRMPLLVGGARELPPRQRTLQDTIAWSHDLLTSDDRRTFRRMGVFVGGCRLDAAQALEDLNSPPGRSALSGLISLVDKNLLRREGGPDAEPRFTMLETIREFGLEQLAGSGELEPARRAHAAYYLTWLAGADPRRSPPPAGGWVHCLDLEYANLRAAMRWSLDHGDLALVAAAGTALTRYGIFRGYFGELRRWWEEALERSSGADPSVWPTVAFLLAIVLFFQGDHERVIPLLNDSLARFRLQGHKWGTAHALLQLGWAAPLHGELQSAVPQLREAETLFRELEQYEDVAWTLLGLGLIAQLRGDFAAAETFYVQALAGVRELRQPSSIAQALAVDGILGLVFAFLGSAALLRGDVALADARLREGVFQCARVSDPSILGTCVLLLAGVALARARHRRAVHLVGAAEALWSATASDVMPAHRPVYERIYAELRGHFDERAFESARARGVRMSLPDVVALALGAEDGAPVDDPLMELTRREREVGRLAARGLRNREIARALVITEGTARVHVEHVLAKLNLHSRAQLAAWAVEQGVFGS